VFAAALTVAPAIAYMVPRNTPTDQLRELSKEACEVEDNWFQPLNGSPRLKMRTSYYGNLAFQHNPSDSTGAYIDNWEKWEVSETADSYSLSSKLGTTYASHRELDIGLSYKHGFIEPGGVSVVGAAGHMRF